MPKFSIIAVDYENHVPRDGMVRGLDSISNQLDKDYEIIIVHDGPKKISYEEEYDFSKLENVKFLNTPERMNDWGHSSRDLGMRNATGEYYINFNIDNILYEDALLKINNSTYLSKRKIFIFPILHWKIGALYEIQETPFLLEGLPVEQGKIDVMQFVAHKDLWRKQNYWYDKSENSDGLIYKKMYREHGGAYYIGTVLGENF